MAIFKRLQKPAPAPIPEQGNANLAKRVGSDGVGPVRAGNVESPIYQFETTVQRDVQRGRGWYVGWSVFFALAIGINVWIQQYLGAITFTLLAVLIFISASKRPNKVKVSIHGSGITIGNEQHPWHNLETFWILHEPPELNSLHLKRRTKILNELTIDLGKENPLKIRDLLLPWLPEDPTREESKVDLVTRTLKL